MKKALLIAAVAFILTGCNDRNYVAPAATQSQADVYTGPEFEIERCDYDDHPNEPECRGSARHKKWLAEQQAKKQKKYSTTYKYVPTKSKSTYSYRSTSSSRRK